MNTSSIQRQIQSYVEQLSPERLTVALDFLAYLVEREANEATEELLTIPGFREELGDVEANMTSDELVDWQDIHDIATV
ncbi:MAG: hypothetical protein F6K16_36940 [Symploca sp. SIO2B6]|nr:hypothetical protein [Symploca sp. SIO2B6]